jgi:hypothetical protein
LLYSNHVARHTQAPGDWVKFPLAARGNFTQFWSPPSGRALQKGAGRRRRSRGTDLNLPGVLCRRGRRLPICRRVYSLCAGCA